MSRDVSDVSTINTDLPEVEISFSEPVPITGRRTRITVLHDANGGTWEQTYIPIEASTLEGLRLQHEAGDIELVEGQMLEEDFRAQEMAWIQANHRELAAKFPGEWIAIEGAELVAHAGDMLTLLGLARDKGHPHPFVTAIPGKPISNLYV